MSNDGLMVCVCDWRVFIFVTELGEMILNALMTPYGMLSLILAVLFLIAVL